MVEKLKEIGALLREHREKLKKTITDISKETRIKEKYLEAIELGDISVFPAEIYLIGYIKAYAKAVGLSEEELKFCDAKSRQNMQIEYSKPKEEAIQKTQRKPLPLSISTMVMVLAVVVILVGIIIFVRGRKYEVVEERIGTPVEGLVDTTISKLLKTSTEELSQVIFCKTGPINPEWAIERVDSVTLEIETERPTTILIETDYRRAFKGTINPGTRKSWRAKNAFYLTIGQPGYVKLWFNGFPLQRLLPTPAPMELYINRGNVLNLIETGESQPIPKPKPIISKQIKTRSTKEEEIQQAPQEKPESTDSAPAEIDY